MPRGRKPKGTTPPEEAQPVPSRLARALEHAKPTPPAEARRKMTLYLGESTAARLNLHCFTTREEMSSFVDRAVTSALDAAGARKIDG